MTGLWAISHSAWDARRPPGDGPAPRMSAEGYAIASGVAEIPLVGVVASDADFWWGQMCDPARLAKAIREADADPAVSEIRLIVNSPGGSGSAMRDAHLALRACSKPTSAYVTDQCLSAAYWIASGCKRIAAHPLAMVGCIGTIVRGCQWAPDGVIEKTLRSEQTPRKAPDLAADDWDRQWQPILDEATALFLGDIASARGWTDDAASRVGQGITMAASAALAAGLIDAIADTPAGSTAPTPAPGGDAKPEMKTPARAGMKPTRTAQGAQSMDPELEKMIAERDALAAKVAELEAELMKLRDEDAAAEEAEAAPAAEAMARIAKLEAQLSDERRERFIETRMAAGDLVPAKRPNVEKLYLLGGEALVDETYPRGKAMLPRPVGHGQPAASGGGGTLDERQDEAIKARMASDATGKTTYRAAALGLRRENHPLFTVNG